MKGDITKIDANFKQQSAEISGNDKIYTLPNKDIDLYGGFYDFELGYFQRMDASVAKSVSYGVEVLSSNTAGIRAKFKTNSTKLGIEVSYKYLLNMSHMPLSGSSGFSLVEETENGYEFVLGFRPESASQTGYTAQATLKEGMRSYILFFPLYNEYITQVKLIFDGQSTVIKGDKYAFDLPILYYGSSITQGGCCSRPDNCYQAYISKWHNVDYINLGFSGGAKAEDEMIEYLAKIKSKVFVCDYDFNAPNAEHLKATHYKLYSAYRKANPKTPVIFMSRPNFERDITDSAKRVRVIKQTYLKAKAEGDENVYFIDGRKLFGKNDRQNCTVDGCHPNDLGFYRMAVALDRVLKPLLK